MNTLCHIGVIALWFCLFNFYHPRQLISTTGGYSAPSKESKSPGTDRRTIAEPVAKRLYFAGEYTEDNFSSMNAALDSGQRAAQLVVTSLGRALPIPSKL